MPHDRPLGAEPKLVDAKALPPDEDSAASSPEGSSNTPPLTAQVQGAIPHDEADGRKAEEWESRYPPRARTQIREEAWAVTAILAGALLMICLLWNGTLAETLGCVSCKRPAFSRYGYFFLGGILGGTLFGIKFLYHVVAKGYWNQDRRLWRFLSPWLAGSLAFIVGVLTDAGFLGLTISASKPPAFLALGFITGYFGDKALAKMTEMADVIFGTRDAPKPSSTKGNESK